MKGHKLGPVLLLGELEAAAPAGKAPSVAQAAMASPGASFNWQQAEPEPPSAHG